MDRDRYYLDEEPPPDDSPPPDEYRPPVQFRPAPTLADLLAGEGAGATVGDRPPSEFEPPPDFGPPAEPDGGPPPSYVPEGSPDWGAPEADRPPSEFEAPSSFAPLPDYGPPPAFDWGAPTEGDRPPSEFEAPSQFAPSAFDQALPEPDLAEQVWGAPRNPALAPAGGGSEAPGQPDYPFPLAAPAETAWDFATQVAMPTMGRAAQIVRAGGMPEASIPPITTRDRLGEALTSTPELAPVRGLLRIGREYEYGPPPGFEAGPEGDRPFSDFEPPSRVPPGGQPPPADFLDALTGGRASRLGAAMDRSQAPYERMQQEVRDADPTGGWIAGPVNVATGLGSDPFVLGGGIGGLGGRVGVGLTAAGGAIGGGIAAARGGDVARGIESGAGIGGLVGGFAGHPLEALGERAAASELGQAAGRGISVVDRAVRDAGEVAQRRGLVPGLSTELVDDAGMPVRGADALGPAPPATPPTRVPQESTPPAGQGLETVADAVSDPRTGRVLRPAAQEVVDAYEQLSAQRAPIIRDTSVGIAQRVVQGVGGARARAARPDPRPLLEAAFDAGKRMLADAKTVVTEIRPEQLDEIIATDRAPRSLFGTGMDEEAAARAAYASVNGFEYSPRIAKRLEDERVAKKLEVAPRRKNERVTLDEAREFNRTVARADRGAIGSTEYQGQDPDAVARMYALVGEGELMPNERQGLVYVYWKKATERITTLHHHFGLVDSDRDYHAGMHAGLRELLEGAVPEGITETTLPSGRRLMGTPWLVGPSAEDDMRMASLMATMPPGVYTRIANGTLTDPEDVAAALLRGGMGPNQPLKAAAVEQGLARTTEQLTAAGQKEDYAYHLAQGVNANRTESLILDPSLHNVEAIYVQGPPGSPERPIGLSKQIPEGGRTPREAAEQLADAVERATGTRPPVIVTPLEPGMTKLIDPRLSPGRGAIVDRYTRAGYPNIGAVAPGLGLPQAANVAGALAGGAAGYAASPETDTPQQRLERTLAGAGLGGALGGAARGFRRGGLRGALGETSIVDQHLGIAPGSAAQVEPVSPAAQYGRFPAQQWEGTDVAARLARWEPVPAGEVRAAVQDIPYVSPGHVRELLTDPVSGTQTPAYLKDVQDYMLERRDRFNRGEMTVRDVAKAYGNTLASIGSGEVDVATAERLLGRAIPDHFLSYDKNGKAMVRPEEISALWMQGEMGQRALNAIDPTTNPRGVSEVDQAAWDDLIRVRSGLGRSGLESLREAPSGLTEPVSNLYQWKPGFKQPRDASKALFNLANLEDLTAELNASGGDPAKLNAALTRTYGISEGKTGFIGSLLGFGETPTFDAVEANMWIAGQGDIAKLKTREADLIRWLKGIAVKPPGAKRSMTVGGYLGDPGVSAALRDRMLDGFNELKAQGVGADIDPTLFAHIMHHWVWDRAKGATSTHAGLMDTMRNAAVAPGLGLPQAANVAGALAGGAAGYASSPETDTPGQRLERTLAGAGIGGALGGAARGFARGGLRGALAESSIVDQHLGIVPPEVARGQRGGVQLPDDPAFHAAVANTPGAEITPDGLRINLIRFQKAEQAGAETARSGVHYLPESVGEGRYKSDYAHAPVGGSQEIAGETLLRRPLVLDTGEGKGYTAGQVVRDAFGDEDARALQDEAENIGNDLLFQSEYGDGVPAETVPQLTDLLQQYGLPEERAGGVARSLVENYSDAEFPYAVTEAVAAEVARQDGHDALVSMRDGHLDEVFDLRESHYPTPEGDFRQHPEFGPSSIAGGAGRVDPRRAAKARQAAEAAGQLGLPGVAEPAAPRASRVPSTLEANFLRDSVLTHLDDPRPEDTLNQPGLAHTKAVLQAHLGEILPEGAVLYHETSVPGARQVIQRAEQGPRSASIWTSDNPDLALGQGGRGVVLEIDPTLANGAKNTNPAKALTDLAGEGAEYHVSKTLRGAVQAIVVRTQRQADQLARDPLIAARFDFANAAPVENGIRVPRAPRGAREVPPGTEPGAVPGEPGALPGEPTPDEGALRAWLNRTQPVETVQGRTPGDVDRLIAGESPAARVPGEPGALPAEGTARPGAIDEFDALSAPEPAAAAAPEPAAPALPGDAGALPPISTRRAAPAGPGAPVPPADLAAAAAAAPAEPPGQPRGLRRNWDRTRNAIAAEGPEGKIVADAVLEWRNTAQPLAGELLAEMPTVKTLSGPQREALAQTRDAPLTTPPDPQVARALDEWRGVKDRVEMEAQAAGLDTLTLALPGDGREIERAASQIAKERLFGPGSRAEAAVAQLRARDPNAAATVEQLRDVAISPVEKAPIRDTLRGAQSFLRMDLGLLSNAIQTVNTAAVVGALRHPRAFARLARQAMSPEGQAKAERMGVILAGGIDAMQDALGSGQPGAKGRFIRAVGAATAPGFGPVERFNRTLAALAGEDYAVAMAERVAKGGDAGAERAITKLGLDLEAVRAQGGVLTESQRVAAARNVVDRTQYQVDPQDLPYWASSPTGRLVTQFKSFSYNQPGFVLNEILKPAYQERRFGPMATWLMLGIPAGLTVIQARQMAGLDFSLGPHDDETWPGYAYRGFARAGGFGLPGDVEEQGRKAIGQLGKGKTYEAATTAAGEILGPTASTAMRYGQLLSQADRGDPTELGRTLLRDVPPMVGPALQNLLMPYSRLADHVAPETTSILSEYGVPLTNPAYTPDPREPHMSIGQLQLLHRTQGPLVDASVQSMAAAPTFKTAPRDVQTAAIQRAVTEGKRSGGKDADPIWQTPRMIAALDTIPEADLTRLAAAYDAAPKDKKIFVLQRDNYALADYKKWVDAQGGGYLNRPDQIAAYVGARP